MDSSRNRQNENLGVNKMGKNIRKSPIHQPNFGSNNAARPQPQPQIYNISKNDFRNIVQQLTGSPSQDPQPPRPPQNPPKPQSMRLHRIRPPPLTPINRPNVPAPIPGPVPVAPPQGIVNSNMPRPAQFSQPPPRQFPPLAQGGDSHWPNPAESPISAYMRYLQNSMLNPSPVANPALLAPQPQIPAQMHPQAPPSGLLPNPNPPVPALPPPRINGPPPAVPNLPSPHWNGPALLPSPTSQFLLPSPTGYYNLLSPKSPYPLLSPGIQFSPPLTPNFGFPSMPQSGILGPGPHPPPSPGVLFPLSPSGIFPISSPRWRDQ
ncbi:protein HAIKU1-like [Momordica charantia]|uniref:Protein HAIKU1-like n=1 Tax=Momordica charantia TaxID=3673 RepID=A0A6J1CWP9_MOMCH|nr:protein HAIKU1-like [Momordica charantia]